MPLLFGVMGAGTQEETSCVVDFFWAALWDPTILYGLQTQLGLLVDELTAQLKQKTDTRSEQNTHRDIYICSDRQHKRLILCLAFMNFHRSPLGVGRCVGHGDKTTLSPLASMHKAPIGPHRTSDSEFRSQCCDDKRYHLCHCVCYPSFYL